MAKTEKISPQSLKKLGFYLQAGYWYHEWRDCIIRCEKPTWDHVGMAFFDAGFDAGQRELQSELKSKLGIY